MPTLFYTIQVEFQDVRVQFQDWPPLKPNFPFGQLPVLEVDGEMIGQSVAIANHLAREFDLYGKTNMEKCRIDQVVGIIQDFIQSGVKVMFEKDEAKKAELKKVNEEEEFPRYLGFLEKFLQKNGNGYFVGSGFTLADIFVYDTAYNALKRVPTAIDKFPLLKAHYNKVGALPQIKAYVDARKPSDF
ncbi:glutathione S-transferase [Elysia marginata]|uniref:Glutathione S-transferase n=1 Tax=Elysia marginata TaxID=1093978 RepID=A0AAV4I0L4_9GAST|nr:glutathione S-transferase [Elysia marginata]